MTSTVIYTNVRQPLPGRSAFEIAKDNGFVGTELEWLDMLYDLRRMIVVEASMTAKTRKQHFCVVDGITISLPQTAIGGDQIELHKIPNITIVVEGNSIVTINGTVTSLNYTQPDKLTFVFYSGSWYLCE